MEESTHILRAVDKVLYETEEKERGFAQHVIFAANNEREDTLFDVSLVGLCEASMRQGMGECSPFFAIRKALYGLAGFAHKPAIKDWGDILASPSTAESSEAAQEMLQKVARRSRFMCLLGDTHAFDILQYRTLVPNPITWLNIDRVPDIETINTGIAERKITEKNHLNFVLRETPAHYIHLGHQRHTVAADHIHKLKKNRFELLSLGQIKDSMEETECRIRQADGISFDLCAIKKYVPAVPYASVFGLTAQEACQLSGMLEVAKECKI